MSSHQSQHDKLKERMRELAQRERANKTKAAETSRSKPLFDKPSKVQSSSKEDPEKAKIQDVLGKWHYDIVSGSKRNLEVEHPPATPQPETAGGHKKGFAFKHPPGKTNNGAWDPKTGGHEADSAKSGHSSKKDDHRRSRDSADKTGSEHRGHHSNYPRNRMPSDGGGGIEGGGGGGSNHRRSHSSDRSSHFKHNNPHSQSSSQQQQQASSLSTSSSQSPVKASSGSGNHQLTTSPHSKYHSSRHMTSPNASSHPNKSHNLASKPIQSAPRKSPKSSSVFQPPKDGNLPAPTSRGEVVPPNGINRGLAAKSKNLPNLLMPSSENNRSGFELHKIFKEMRDIAEPVSEINTPRKSESQLSFPLPVRMDEEPITEIPDVTVTAEPDIQDEEERKSQVSSIAPSERLLDSDLVVSDDSDAELGATDTTTDATAAATMLSREGETRGAGMSSGSDSSSEGSDSSSGSDGETSSSDDEAGKDDETKKKTEEEEEEACATPKENHSWGLSSFFNQLKQPSPEAPLLKKTTLTKEQRIDETNEGLIDKLIHTDISSQHMLKEIGPASTLPFSTDHLNPDSDSDSDSDINVKGDSSCDNPPARNTDKSWKASAQAPLSPPHINDSVSNSKPSKPEKKGRGRPSLSSSDSRKSESSAASKSNSSTNKSKTTPKKDSKKEKSSKSSSQDEKKRQYKSKATISDSDDSEIDVVSVTPEVKSNAPSSNVSPEEKDKLRRKMFSSPKSNKSSSPVKMSQEKENSVSKDKEISAKDKENNVSKDKEKGKEAKHKTSSHRKKDRDRDKDKSDISIDKKRNDKKALSPLLSSDKHVNDMITNEFKPQSLLSPFSSPGRGGGKFPLSPSPRRAASPTCPRLTYSKGKPTIMVDISLNFLDHVPHDRSPSPCASPRSMDSLDILSVVSKGSDSFTENERHSEPTTTGGKTPDRVSHKKLDIKSADVAKGADKSQKNDGSEKKHSPSEKSVKTEKQSSKDKSAKSDKSVDKSAKSEKNVDKSAKSEKNADKSAKSEKNVDKSSKNVEKNPDKSAKSVERNTDSKNSDKSMDKCAKSVDKSTKSEERSVDKSIKSEERSVDKSTKSEERSVDKKVDKGSISVSDKSDKNAGSGANNLDKSQCKIEVEDEDMRDSETHDKMSRSHKRKSTSDRSELNSSSKRHKSSSKSSKKSSSSESLHNGSSNSQPDSQENGTKTSSTSSSSTSSSSQRERRGSTSSTSSRHSSTSSSSKHKKIKLDEKATKKEPQSPEKHNVKKEKVEVAQQNGQDHLPFHSYNNAKVKAESLQNGPRVPPTHMEDRLEPAEKYLSKAKELKHLADKDKPAKFSLYVKSVLSFVQCGCAMEKEAISEPQKIFTMYHETLQLLKQVIRVRGTCIDPDVPINDKRLSVLLLRIQSLLCLKLYNLKRSEVMKFKKIIDADNNKAAATAKSPHQTTIYNRSIGTPPPISPTPSPAGSIGSVGSQGSCELPSNKLTNGSLSAANTPMSSPGTVSVSQRIHSVTQQYIHLTGYFVTGHDLWIQADDAAQEFKEFFNMLDNTCGPLSLHSSVLHLVRYVNDGLHTMKDT